MCLVRTLTDGTVTREWLPPEAAALEAIAGPQNGVTVRSCRVLWGEVIDRWGGSG